MKVFYIDNVYDVLIDDIQEVVYFYVEGDDELKSIPFDAFKLSNMAG